jgi:hypothetical protein
MAIVRVPLGSRASSAGDAPTAVARAPRPSTHSTATTTTVRAERVWPATTETSIIEGHGARWTFGATATQDRVLMGDWNCDGVDTPALVRTRSGAIFVIDDWPDGGEATARYVTTVDGAVDATVEQGPSCDSLAITTTDGERVTPSMRAPGA